MKTIATNTSIRSPITTALGVGVIATLLITPVSYMHAAPPQDTENNRKAFGHLIAPGFLKNFDMPEIDLDWLPAGIAKKLDRKDPTIEIITVDSLATSTATITAVADESVTATLYADTTSGFATDAAAVTNVSDVSQTEHSFALTGLIANTTYFYRILITDESGNESLSAEASFTTDAGAVVDTVGPIVTNIVVEADNASASVLWDTNEPSTSIVYYSTDAVFDIDAPTTVEVSNLSLVTEHTIALPGLMASETYYLAVASVDASGNYTLSSIASFTTDATPDVTSPVLANVAGVAATTSITGSWTTDELATSALYTSTVSGFALTDAGVIVTQNPALTTNHELVVNGLTTATTYYHRIKSVDAAGNETISAEFAFGTI